MTRRKAKILFGRLKVAVVIGAAVWLVAGAATLGDEQQTEKPDKKVVRIEGPAETKASSRTTEEPTEEPKEEPEYQSMIMSRDWDAEESEMLAKIAEAEAGNQDTEGKALVICVVLNRVRSDKFPGTIREVLYQKNQFTPILTGSYDEAKPDDDCLKALDMVMRGWDESQGALYFESKSESTWHEENLKFLFKHGGHYFYTEREE